jgi:hypothetical protein
MSSDAGHTSRLAWFHRGLLTTLPVWLLLNAQDVRLDTRVEINGSALRRIEVQASPSALDVIKFRRMMESVVDGRRTGQMQRGQTQVLWRDDRVANLASCDGVDFSVDWTLFSPRVRYTYKDTVTLHFDRESDRQEAAKGSMGLVYSVRMPGRIDDLSMSPKRGGTAEGSTVTWQLSAEQEEHVVEVTSEAMRYDYLVFSICVALGAVWLIVRVILERRLRTPVRV